MADSTVGYGKNILQQALKGATFGFDDELISVLRSPIRAFQTGESFGGAYSGELADIRREKKQFEADHPILSFAAELAGSAGPTMATAPVSAASKLPMTQAMLQGAKTGALQSGLQGFGEGEGGLLSRADRAVSAGILGATIGAPLGVLGRKASPTELQDAGEKIQRKAMGFGAREYKRGLGTVGKSDLREGKLALEQSISRLRKGGILDASIINDPSEYMLNSQVALNTLDDKLNRVLLEADTVIQDQGGLGFEAMELLPEIKADLKRILGDSDLKNAMKTVVQELEAIDEVGVSTLKDMNKLKRRFYRANKALYEKSTDTNAAVKSEVQASIANKLEQKIEQIVEELASENDIPQKLSGQVQRLNQKMGDILSVEPVAVQNLIREQTEDGMQQLMRIIATTGGGGALGILPGAVTGNPLLMGVGALTGAAINNPTTKYKVGGLMSDVGGALGNRGLRSPIGSGRIAASTADRLTNVGQY